MRKKDRFIQEAFQVYESANDKQLASEYTEEEIAYAEGFEDKIFYCIEKLHIPNPRQKAKRIYLGILLILLVCVCAGFLLYYQKNKPVAVTEQIDNIYQEAKEYQAEQGLQSYPMVFEENDKVQYNLLYLNKELGEKLLRTKSKWRRVKKTARVITIPVDSVICGTEAAYGYNLSAWQFYELSDRKSHCYYMLTFEDNVALARYSCQRETAYGTVGLTAADVCKEIYGITSAEDIRAITLQRYQAKSKNDAEKLVAMYTKEEAKKAVFSFFEQDAVIHDIEKTCYDEGTKTGDVRWQPIESIRQESWKAVTEKQPQKCYLLALENQYHENYLMGIVKEGDKVQVFVDMSSSKKETDSTEDTSDTSQWEADSTNCLELSVETQKQMAEWIDKAEKTN